MKDDLLDIALKTIEKLKGRIDQADVFLERRKVISLEMKKSSFSQIEVSYDEGLSVRAFYKGGRGFSSCSPLIEENIDKVVESAIALARSAQPDPDFKSLPSAEEGKEVKGLYDEKVAELSPNELVDWGKEILESAQSVEKTAIISGGISSSYVEFAIANTEGVAIEDKRTSIGAGVMVILNKGEEVASYFDFDQARRLQDFNPVDIGEKACLQAKEFFGAKQAPTGSYPVVFSYLASSGIVGAIAGAAIAEEIQRKRSYLVGKKGEKIAWEGLTIRDLPLIEGGLASSSYDGEGVPHKELTLIEDGILKNYFHNSYTAGKAQEENTGHASRGSYRYGVGISPTNLQVDLGDWSLDEMIKDMKNGILILQTSIQPNPVSGDVSGPIDFGFMVENGEKTYPLKNTMLGFNMLDLLQKIDAISRDYREEPGVKMPAIRVQNLRIGGGR
ncbi:TldD/PmbA family protein [bacterium]|nr:TldD/PmbA family protein [bacterium]